MPMRTQKMSAVHGFTLVELLIAMVLASLIGMAAYTVFSSSSRSYMVQQDVTEAQQNLRVAMDLLARDIRSAGFGVPDPPFSLSIGGEEHTAPVAIVNSSTGPDSITLLGSGEEKFWIDTDHAQGAMTLNIVAQNSGDLDDFFDGSSFDPNRAFISLDGIYFTTISGITRSGATAALNLTMGLNRPYRDGTPVFLIKAIRYTINTTLSGCSNQNPCLARQDLAETNEVLAPNVEDIQLAYNLQGSSTFTNDASSSDVNITAVRANILSRTRSTHSGPGANITAERPALEDRAAAGSQDAYRRRLLTSVIKLRNPRAGS